MKQTFGFMEVNGYAIANLDGRQCLIDTGAKTCVGDTPFTLFGETFPTVKKMLDLDAERLGKSVGCHLDYLVGLDVLGKWPWTIDWPRKTITFHLDGTRDFDGVRVPLLRHGVFTTDPRPGDPYWLDINFRLDGRDLRALFDTGCAIGGFVPRNAVTGAPDFRGFRDFFPSYGPFSTDLYRRNIDVGGREFSVDLGCLPEGLPLPADFYCVGNPILREGPATIDVPGGAMYLSGPSSIN